MPVKIESHAEPIPGYRLIERLGGGGFGEVWKAEAPGGLHKAIKFVYGDLEASDEDGARAEQELKALSRVKTVHHPYILSLERYDIIDGQLLIVMELADRTLWDRFKECRAEGLRGIPRQELLGYLLEAAEALDLMNFQYQLQHLDIKPQNLFLTHNHIKVADFGLVKDLEGNIASVTGGVTPVYAAPETFEGYVSCFSDQYSLAIVYQELLSGQRPFQGTTLRQLVMQHMREQPNLSSLPPADRPVVARALEKNPEKRFPTCAQFISTLAGALASGADSTIPGRQPAIPELDSASPPPANPQPPPVPAEDESEVQTRGRRRGLGSELVRTPGGDSPANRNADSRTTGSALLRGSGFLTPGAAVTPQALVLPAAPRTDEEKSKFETRKDPSRRVSEFDLSPSAEGEPDWTNPQAEVGTPPSGPGAAHQTTVHPLRMADSQGKPQFASRPPQSAEDGVQLPVLVIGLGGLGQKVLCQLRGEIIDHRGSANVLPHIRFLYLDTDPEGLQRATASGSSATDAIQTERALLPQELLLARLYRAAHYLRPRTTDNPLESWLPQGALYRIPRQQVPAGMRCLGRLAFVDNYSAIRRRLQSEINALLGDCADRETGRQGDKDKARAGLSPCLPVSLSPCLRSLRTNEPRVYIVTALGGGTGSGMFLDLAYTVRQLLREQGCNSPDVVGVFLLPPAGKTPAHAQALANATAALRELDYFSSNSSKFQARYPGVDASSAASQQTHCSDGGAPFRRCLVIADVQEEEVVWKPPAPEDEAPAEVLLATSALYLDLCTPLGRLADRQRQEWLNLNAPWGAEGSPLAHRHYYQSAGVFRVVWPRQPLLTRVARLSCRKLVQRWMNKDAAPLRGSIRDWVGQQWEGLRLSAEQLISRLQELCQRSLRQTPEALFAALTLPLAQVVDSRTQPPAKEPIQLDAVFQALGQLEQILGLPEGCKSPSTGQQASSLEPSLLEETLRDGICALGNECELKLAELVVRLIEQPEFRLAGAEETIRQFNAAVEQTLAQQETLGQELQERTRTTFERLLALLENPETTLAHPAQEPPSWKLGFGRKKEGEHPARELLELLRAYPKYRYQSLILQHISSFYISLRGQLSDQLREVDYCRHRLSELAEMFNDDNPTRRTGRLPPSSVQLPSPAGVMLFPEGCKKFEDAVKLLDKRLQPADLQQLDQQVQELIRGQFQALVHVCMASANMVRSLQPAMQTATEQFLLQKLGNPNIARMFLEKLGAVAGQEGNLVDEMHRALDDAGATLGRNTGTNELTLFAVGSGPEAEHLRKALQVASEGIDIQPVDCGDEIILYRERWHLSLAELKLPSKAAREIYDRLSSQEASTPHTRIDISCWRTGAQ